MQYVQDSDEIMPPCSNDANNGTSWRTMIQPYVKSTQLFVCPSNPKNTQNTLQDNGLIRISYAGFSTASIGGGGQPDNFRPFVNGPAPWANPGDLVPLSRIQSPSTVPMVGETVGPYPDMATQNIDDNLLPHLSTWNVLWADGHVKSGKPLSLCQAPNTLHISGSVCTTTEIAELAAIQAKYQ